MAHQKKIANPETRVDLVNLKAIYLAIENQINNISEGIIVFDSQGKIISINNNAAHQLGVNPKNIINKFFWQQFKLDLFSQKRQFIHARNSFLLAKEGLAQQFIWVESKSTKPILAYNIMINKAEIHGTSVFFAKINDILQAKITEWVLWSLAKIRNHHEINGVIDEILKLASEVFSAEYALVGLIDKQQTAHLVSCIHQGKKTENISYPLANSPCEQVQISNSIRYFEGIQNEFPDIYLLKEMDVNYYLGGPITNTEQRVVGIMSVLKREKIELNGLNNTLFLLFIRRINLEIERLLSQRKLQFLASIPQQDPNPVLRIIPSGDVVFANAQGKILLQYWKQHHSGLPKALLEEALSAKSNDEVLRIEIEADNKTYLLTLVWIADFNQINIYGTDISQLKNTEQEIITLARLDALTQVANRQYFEDKLMETIQNHSQENEKMALLLIDLDDFKIVNDTLGHLIGDQLLKAASKRMAGCIRQEDFIARLGGDEFIVLLNKSDNSSATMITKKMVNILARPFQFGEHQITITASIGVALYPDVGLSTAELLKHADIAMYHAKKTGKNSYFVFSKSLNNVQDKRNEVIRDELKLAASRNELYIDYQPQIDLHTNKIIGLEALLRWLHPGQGLILPLEFIPEAEKTGCIHLLSQWLIKQSVHDFSRINSVHNEINLTINVSLSQLNDSRFLGFLCSTLMEYNISKSKIILDVSERSITPHFDHVTKILRTIHHSGIGLCLDNFGSPKVSLPKLLALPIQYIKLDPILLSSIGKKNKHRLLLKGVINLTKELDIQVIQKGIETKVQHDIVKSLGCQYGQGFYYYPPVQISEIQRYLINQSMDFKHYDSRSVK